MKKRRPEASWIPNQEHKNPTPRWVFWNDNPTNSKQKNEEEKRKYKHALNNNKS